MSITITSYHCSQSVALGADPNTGNLKLVEFSNSDTFQKWEIGVNIVQGRDGNNGVAGYTLLNVGLEQYVAIPSPHQQITTGSSSSPMGVHEYCWVLTPELVGDTQVWKILGPDPDPSYAMDVQGGQCNIGNPVVFWNTHSGNNQKWIITS